MAHKKKRKRRLGAATEGDLIEAGAAVEKYCPKMFKSDQYVAACKQATEKFVSEASKRGTTPKALADSANAVEEWCGRHYKTGQYASVCRKTAGNMIRAVVKREGAREGRVFPPPFKFKEKITTKYKDLPP